MLFTGDFSVFISNAYAQATSGTPDPTGGFMGLLPMVLIFVVMYFLMIRPQQKKAKEHRAMVEALAKGDEVITQGGIAGKVTQIGENFITLETGENTRITIQKQAIATVLAKGTLKSL